MPERRIVVDELHLDYEGLFDARELFRLIENFFFERKYDKREIKNIERVSATGKDIEIVLMPWRTISDYAKYEIKLRIWIKGMKEVEVKKDDMKLKLNQGKISMIIDAYLTTDVEGHWEGKPFFFFLRTIFDKYIFRLYISKWENGLIQHVKELHSEIKSFLNLQRF